MYFSFHFFFWFKKGDDTVSDAICRLQDLNDRIKNETGTACKKILDIYDYAKKQVKSQLAQVQYWGPSPQKHRHHTLFQTYESHIRYSMHDILPHIHAL